MNKWIGLTALLASAACSSNNKTALQEAARSEMNTPIVTVGGTGTVEFDTTQFLKANAAGTVTSNQNEIIGTFTDPFLPLTISGTSAFSAAVTTGSCTLAPMTTALVGVPVDEAMTTLGATACSDQAVVTVSLNTADFTDSHGVPGTAVVKTKMTVDLAPKVTVQATGNSLITGLGTPESSPLIFSLPVSGGAAGDLSLVMQFSKVVTTLTMTWPSGCLATLGTPFYVGTTHTIVGVAIGLPPSGSTTITPGTVCHLSVAAVADAIGNPDDPTDTNITMPITFQ